jgi:hypothetical protein
MTSWDCCFFRFRKLRDRWLRISQGKALSAISLFQTLFYRWTIKDKTGKDASPANTNRPWGEGDTPIADMLKLIQKNKWPIYCDIELEYPVPADSDARQEVKKCVDYCRDILV